jgi:hypothetical protein
MPKLQQAIVIGEASRLRIRTALVFVVSAFAHSVLLVTAFVVFGSPKLLATVPPESIVVDIVRPDEVDVAKGETGGPTPGAAQPQAKPQAQAQPQALPQAQPLAQPQAQPQTKPQPPAAPIFTALYPWPVAPAASDTQAGDYRTFESTAKLSHAELSQLKTRLKACWIPPAGIAGAKKLTAAVRVAFRLDGTLAGPPELVEATASPFGPALVESALRAVSDCGPYSFLPADSYDTWKALSLTFSPDDVVVAALTK